MSLFHLDDDKFQHNLRTSRRGAAGGPSGMTAEHLRVLLDSPLSLLGAVGTGQHPRGSGLSNPIGEE